MPPAIHRAGRGCQRFTAGSASGRAVPTTTKRLKFPEPYLRPTVMVDYWRREATDENEAAYRIWRRYWTFRASLRFIPAMGLFCGAIWLAPANPLTLIAAIGGFVLAWRAERSIDDAEPPPYQGRDGETIR